MNKKTRWVPTGLQTHREVADDVALSLAGSSTGGPSAGVFIISSVFYSILSLHLSLPFDFHLVCRKVSLSVYEKNNN